MMTQRNIRYPVGFNGQEMEGYFRVSKKDAAAIILNRLTATQLRLWLYLMMIDPFADTTTDEEKVYHPIPSPAEIATKIGASPETVEKDMRKLKKLGLYDYRVTAWQGHNLSAANAKAESERLTKKREQSRSPEARRNPRTRGEREEVQPETHTEQALGLNNPLHGLNNPPEKAETLEKSSDRDRPHTIHNYSDFINTLSEGEREKFFYFVRKETQKLPNPIVDLEAWLASKNAAGQNRWEVYYKLFEKSEGRAHKKTGRELKPRQLSFSERNETKRLARLAGEKWIDPWGIESDV